MGCSALLYYGVHFDHGEELPWSGIDNGYDDVKLWWRNIHGYEDPHELYDHEGNYLPGVTEEMVDEYYTGRREFHRDHPLPIEVTHHCHAEYDMPIIAVVDHWWVADDCYPEGVKPLEGDGAKLVAFQQFCDEYGIDHSKADWYFTGSNG